VKKGKHVEGLVKKGKETQDKYWPLISRTNCKIVEMNEGTTTSYESIASIGQPGSMHDTSMLFHALRHDHDTFPHPPQGMLITVNFLILYMKKYLNDVQYLTWICRKILSC
jgi:hypothetical protein